jgi:hypothetical protein
MRIVSTEHKRVDIRRNDTVKVITGRDKGKEGRVLRVFPNDNKRAPQPAAQHQGRHRRAGEPDCSLQRAVSVLDLRSGTHRS